MGKVVNNKFHAGSSAALVRTKTLLYKDIAAPLPMIKNIYIIYQVSEIKGSRVSLVD